LLGRSTGLTDLLEPDEGNLRNLNFEAFIKE
jgi:hypothetical protein